MPVLTYGEMDRPAAPKCDCGAGACKGSTHAVWCSTNKPAGPPPGWSCTERVDFADPEDGADLAPMQKRIDEHMARLYADTDRVMFKSPPLVDMLKEMDKPQAVVSVPPPPERSEHRNNYAAELVHEHGRGELCRRLYARFPELDRQDRAAVLLTDEQAEFMKNERHNMIKEALCHTFGGDK